MAWTIGLWDDSADSAVQDDGRIVSTYQRVYLMQTDAVTRPSKAQIIAALGIKPGSPNAEDITATCERVQISSGPVKTIPPHLAFLVTVDWSTAAPLPNEDSTDPTTTRITWSVATFSQVKYIVKDRDGNLIKNTAGTPPNGGIPVDDRLGQVVARRNVPALGYDKSRVVKHSGKVNKKKFLGGDPGTVQVDITAEERYEGSNHFWAETYTFSWNPNGWQPEFLSAGLFYKYGEGVRPITIGMLQDPQDFSANSPKVQEPEPLDIAGNLVPIHLRPENCHYVPVDHFQELDFEDEFGIPGD